MIALNKLFKSLDDKSTKVENYPTHKVGKHRDKSLSDYDPKQVKIGLKIEKEHSDDSEVASQITKDHLSEFPKYYTGLVNLEKKLKQGKTI